MTYLVHWGRDHDHTIGIVEELDAVLDQVKQQRGDAGAPFMVDIVDNDADPELIIGLQIGVGHPERGFVFYTGQTMAESGYAVDPDLEPAAGEIGSTMAVSGPGTCPPRHA